MKIMIVDDHAGFRKMIRRLVGGPGDVIVEFTTGEAAIKAARAFKPDCITLDIRLPGLSGMEVARAIRAIHPQSRILIVTSYDEPFLRETAGRLGVAAYVLKENLGDLRATLLGMSGSPAGPSSGSGTGPETSRADEPANPISRDSTLTGSAASGADIRLRVLMVEDSEIDCELLRRQLRRCGYTPLIRRVDNETDMRRALEQDPWDIVFTDHRMPRFSAVEALALIREIGLDLPTLCVTGTIDPCQVAEVLDSGAREVISKNDLTRLCDAVARALIRE